MLFPNVPCSTLVRLVLINIASVVFCTLRNIDTSCSTITQYIPCMGRNSLEGTMFSWTTSRTKPSEDFGGFPFSVLTTGFHNSPVWKSRDSRGLHSEEDTRALFNSLKFHSSQEQAKVNSVKPMNYRMNQIRSAATLILTFCKVGRRHQESRSSPYTRRLAGQYSRAEPNYCLLIFCFRALV